MSRAVAAGSLPRALWLAATGGSPVPDAAFTTFTSADYTPDADGTTATTLTFTVKDANNVAIEGYAVTYA